MTFDHVIALLFIAVMLVGMACSCFTCLRYAAHSDSTVGFTGGITSLAIIVILLMLGAAYVKEVVHCAVCHETDHDHRPARCADIPGDGETEG